MMTSMTQTAEPPQSLERKKKAKKATAVAAFGTFIEYYDFSVFGYVAATLAVVFFPGDDPTAALLSTLLVFAAAFAARPIGAVFFGWLGDRKGRRASLVASIGLMSAAAGLTAFLPGYARVDLHTSYDITDNIQIYGLVKNLFDRKYGLYGTYFEFDEVPDLSGPGFTDARRMSLAQPFAAYGGVKVKF